MWFTPKYTTAKMKEITGNKDFVYEIACDQMCGSGHYSMKGIVIVETQEEYDNWKASLKPQYLTVMGSKESPAAAAPASDSLKTAAMSTESKPLAKK
jgi:cytochrome c oxidase subunit 2